jgi:hypothetical protein
MATAQNVSRNIEIDLEGSRSVGAKWMDRVPAKRKGRRPGNKAQSGSAAARDRSPPGQERSAKPDRGNQKLMLCDSLLTPALLNDAPFLLGSTGSEASVYFSQRPLRGGGASLACCLSEPESL